MRSLLLTGTGSKLLSAPEQGPRSSRAGAAQVPWEGAGAAQELLIPFPWHFPLFQARLASPSSALQPLLGSPSSSVHLSPLPEGFLPELESSAEQGSASWGVLRPGLRHLEEPHGQHRAAATKLKILLSLQLPECSGAAPGQHCWLLGSTGSPLSPTSVGRQCQPIPSFPPSPH